MSRTIRVENLTPGITEARVERLFAQLAQVRAVAVVAPAPGAPATAYVELETEEQAVYVALVFHGRKLGGRTLRATRVPEAPFADEEGPVEVPEAPASHLVGRPDPRERRSR